MRRRAFGLLVAAALTGLTACGDDDPKPAAQAPPTATQTAPPAAGTPAPAPRGGRGRITIPRRERTDRQVVEGWLAALTAGDVVEAAKYFAPDALVSNGSPVLQLRTFDDRQAFNESFPCGATVGGLRRRSGYLLVTYVLTDRADSKCDAPGGEAEGAIKVRDGRIVEWFRLANGDTPPPALQES